MAIMITMQKMLSIIIIFLSNFYNVFGRKYIIRVKNEYVPKTREMNRTSFILNG